MKKKFLLVVILIAMALALVPPTPAQAGGGSGSLIKVPDGWFANSKSQFAHYVERMKAGLVVRESLNLVKLYEKWCGWDIAFELEASRIPEQGELTFPNCYRFNFINESDEEITLRFTFVRSYQSEDEWKTLTPAKDPYLVSGKNKPQGLFLGSALGVTVTVTTPDGETSDAIGVRGGYTPVGGKETTVSDVNKFIFDSGEWSAPESADAQGVDGPETGELCSIDFPKDMDGSIIVEIVVPPYNEFDLWKGTRLPADEKPSTKTS